MAKTKKEFKRSDLRQNIMEQVIFRIDYAGLISTEEYVLEFARTFDKHFNKYEVTFHNHIELEMIDIEEISRKLAVPVRELERQQIHRFTQNAFGPDNAILDISKYYSYLHIHCVKYESINPYLKFFIAFLFFLKKHNPLISFKRLGLRKVGTKLYPDYTAVFKEFEQKMLSSPVEGEQAYEKDKTEFVDTLSSTDQIYKFFYRRSVEKGYEWQEKELVTLYRAILDIDGFVEGEKLNEIAADEAKLSETLPKLNELYLFDLFKMSVTEDFLNANSK